MGASAPGRAVQGKSLVYYSYYLASQAAFPRGIFVLFLMSRQFSGELISKVLTLEGWYDGHLAYFRREAEGPGLTFVENEELLLEHFRVLRVLGRAGGA